MFSRFAVFGLGVFVVAMSTAMLVLRGQRKPKSNISGEYVALGSSFAAGLGLGPRQAGSPLVCLRSCNGYPSILARMTGLSLVDMSCSGSTTEHILHGGQWLLGPQVDAIGPKTKLVTVTSGGNDARYVGDLTFASGRAGLLGKFLWRGPKPIGERDFEKITENFREIVQIVKQRAPNAIIVLVSYPGILPDHGTCSSLGFGEVMADMGRQVSARLHESTRLAAEQSGAIFVDMAAASIGHDSCASEPWVNGAAPASGAPFHPNEAGANATALEVFNAIRGKVSAG